MAAALRELARACGVPQNGPRALGVQLEQRGAIRDIDHARWEPFAARERIAVTRCAFAWRARMGRLGLVRGESMIDRGVGRLRISLLGVLPLLNLPRGPALDRSEMIRYLAELVLAPDAMLDNPQLDWSLLPDGRMVVAAPLPDGPARVVLTRDRATGLIERVEAAARPCWFAPGHAPLPWFAELGDYHGSFGRVLPASMRAGWIIDGAPMPMWQARLTGWSGAA